jgi:hypothetical protein
VLYTIKSIMITKTPRKADIHADPGGVVRERIVGYIWTDDDALLCSIIGEEFRRAFLGADVIVIISKRYLLVVAL